MATGQSVTYDTMKETDKQRYDMGVRKANYQGGSTILFIILTIAMAALLVGGVTWLRHRGEVARQTSVAQQEVSGTAPDEVQGEQGGDETDLLSTPTTGQAGEGADEATSADTTGQDGTRDSDVAVEQLPQSGPSEAIASVVAVAALSYVGAQYFSSRRQSGRVRRP